jgi:RNA polymerase sigma-70 factor, ECF subfamily
MTDYDKAMADRVQRFREAVLPCLDDAYKLAYFLMRDRADAEDAVQKCFLRAQRCFDDWRGPAIKPWLLAILRNVCHADIAQHGQHEAAARLTNGAQDGAPIPQLLGALPLQLREIIVLRECIRMSYREIAEVTGVSTGAVMSRLAQARAMVSAGRPARGDAMQGQSGPIRRRECDVS